MTIKQLRDRLNEMLDSGILADSKINTISQNQGNRELVYDALYFGKQSLLLIYTKNLEEW